MFKKTIRVFETFAGIGAQHKAFDILQDEGVEFRVVATSEWDIWANMTYNAIHNHNKNIASKLSDEIINKKLSEYIFSNNSKTPVDIKFIFKQSRVIREKLYSSVLESNNLGSIIGITGKKLIDATGGVDLITYSFPCQDLSAAGSFHGFNQGMKKGGGTRSGLLWEIERILKQLKKMNKLPKFLLLENVRNMISKKHKSDYIEWLKFLRSIGYSTQTYLLDARDYGIPQSRKRIYALSVLNGNEHNFHDTYFDTNIKDNILELQNLPEKDIIYKKGISKKIEDILKIDYADDKSFNEACSAIPNKTPSRYAMYRDNPLIYTERKDKKEFIERTKNKLYTKTKNGYYLPWVRTITTKQDRNPNAGIIDIKKTKIEKYIKELQEQNRVITKKAEYRFLTPRETFLLMGFSDEDFDKAIHDNILRKDILYRQAGNSIVVNVLVAIFYKIIKNIEERR